MGSALSSPPGRCPALGGDTVRLSSLRVRICPHWLAASSFSSLLILYSGSLVILNEMSNIWEKRLNGDLSVISLDICIKQLYTKRGRNEHNTEENFFMTELKIVKVIFHAEKKRGIFGLKNTTISIDSKKSFVSHF